MLHYGGLKRLVRSHEVSCQLVPLHALGDGCADKWESLRSVFLSGRAFALCFGYALLGEKRGGACLCRLWAC